MIRYSWLTGLLGVNFKFVRRELPYSKQLHLLCRCCWLGWWIQWSDSMRLEMLLQVLSTEQMSHWCGRVGMNLLAEWYFHGKYRWCYLICSWCWIRWVILCREYYLLWRCLNNWSRNCIELYNSCWHMMLSTPNCMYELPSHWLWEDWLNSSKSCVLNRCCHHSSWKHRKSDWMNLH